MYNNVLNTSTFKSHVQFSFKIGHAPTTIPIAAGAVSVSDSGCPAVHISAFAVDTVTGNSDSISFPKLTISVKCARTFHSHLLLFLQTMSHLLHPIHTFVLHYVALLVQDNIHFSQTLFLRLFHSVHIHKHK